MARNPDYVRLINTRRWQHLRHAKLSASPWCERCLKAGKRTPAREVHHIRPVGSGRNPRLMESLCYDPANLMSLCSHCHDDIHNEMRARNPMAVTERRKDEARAFDEAYFGSRQGGEGGSVF